jgi:hypothetical protein
LSKADQYLSEEKQDTTLRSFVGGRYIACTCFLNLGKMRANKDSQCRGGLDCRCLLIGDADFEMKLFALFCVAIKCLVKGPRVRLLAVVSREEFEF